MNSKLDDLFSEGHSITTATAIGAKIIETKIYLNDL